MDDQHGAWARIVEPWLGYVWVMLIATWGGTVSYLSRIRRSRVQFSVVDLLREWCISGFAGLLTFFVCQEMGLSPWMTAFAAGISGHAGGRTIAVWEQWLKSRLPK